MHGMPGSRNNATHFAEQYVQAGAVVLAITAPFSRPNDVARRPAITFTEKDRDEQIQLIQLIQDLRRGVDLLANHPRVDAARIGYSGGSYGGAMGGLLAGVEKRIKAFVLWVGDGGLVAHVNGPDDAGNRFHQMAPEQREAWLQAMLPIEPIRFVGMAAPSALFFQSGRSDRVIPAEDADAGQSVQVNASALHSVQALRHSPGAGRGIGRSDTRGLASERYVALPPSARPPAWRRCGPARRKG